MTPKDVQDPDPPRQNLPCDDGLEIFFWPYSLAWPAERRHPPPPRTTAKMPKSKRAKVVHLSKVQKKGKEVSTKLFDNIRECADTYQYCFVFTVENMRNTALKNIRQIFAQIEKEDDVEVENFKRLAEQYNLPKGRLFFGKTKVMAKALGTTPEEEHLPNLSKLSKHLAGNVGLLFTDKVDKPETILEFFNDYTVTDYARAGVQANREFTVPEGIVYSRGGEVAVEEDAALPHSVEPMLRKWGMPTKLVRGKITLDDPYTVCTEGQMLNSHQTALLKQFGVAMADFSVKVKA